VRLVIGVSIFSGLIFFTIMMIAVRAQRAPIRTGEESMEGRKGITRTGLSPNGSVQLGGELWSAELADEETCLPAGSRVQVFKVYGLRLILRKTD